MQPRNSRLDLNLENREKTSCKSKEFCIIMWIKHLIKNRFFLKFYHKLLISFLGLYSSTPLHQAILSENDQVFNLLLKQSK